jgi:hypothetical protein
LSTLQIRGQELLKQEKRYQKNASGRTITVITIGISIVMLSAFVAAEKGLPSNMNLNNNVGLVPGTTATTTESLFTTALDSGNVDGLVIGEDGLPVIGASIVAYKQMGLIDSVEMLGGFTAKSITSGSGYYSFDELPSGVYTFTVLYPDGKTQVLSNYAVWPNRISEHSFE